MCLGVPMQVKAIPQEGQALVESFGARKTVRTVLIGPVTVGDYLMIHAGYAIEKIDTEEARERLQLWEELLAEEGSPGGEGQKQGG